MTPGEADLARFELQGADDALAEVEQLLATGKLKGATSRLYYSVFHAARAGLTLEKLHSKTHAGLIALFERTFGPTPILGRLLELRGEADYAMKPFERSEAELREALAQAKQFIERCRALVAERTARAPDEEDPPPDV